MSTQIDQIAQFLFETDNLENISVDQLRQLVDEFPSFNAGHYLLTQKLQDQGSPELNKEAQKTVLYFHNPFWLRWLLDRAKAEARGEESSAAFAETGKETSANGGDTVEMKMEEVIVTNDTSWSSGTIIEQAEEIRGETFTITEIISRFENELKDEQHFNRMQSAELEQVSTHTAEPTSADGRAVVSEEIEQAPHFLRPEDGLNDLEVARSGDNGDPYTKDELPSPIAEWQEKLATESELRKRSTVDEVRAAEQVDAPVTHLDVQEFSSIEGRTEVVPPPAVNQIADADHLIRRDDQPDHPAIPDQPVDHAVDPNQQAYDAFDEIEEEVEEQEPETKRVYFFWEKEFYTNQPAGDQGSEHIEENTMATPEPEELRAPVVDESIQDLKKEQKDEVPLFFDAALSARENEKSGVENFQEVESKANQAIEEIPSPLSTILEKEMQEADKPQSELSFQPYHTIDYFASQGIRFIQEENPTDKFGKQLKSFTAWLKTMKRLPQSMIETEMSATAEAAILSIAQHSLDEKEVVTEAMAEVLFLQGRFDRALEMYNQLSLLDPSKNTYFAAKISEIKSHLI